MTEQMEMEAECARLMQLAVKLQHAEPVMIALAIVAERQAAADAAFEKCIAALERQMPAVRKQ